MKIYIDPGHGGRDPGAIGPLGTQEKNVTLAISKFLKKHLNHIADIKLTREEDKNLGIDIKTDLMSRVRIAEKEQADYFLSIHINAAEKSARGVETYALAPGGQGEKLARAIQNKLVIETKLIDRGVKFANFYVLRQTSMPAVLVEIGFISNPEEDKLLRNPSFQEKCAWAVAQGVAQHIGKSLPTVTPLPNYNKTIPVSVKGEVIQGILIEGRTFVWVNDFAKALGMKSRWDSKERKVYLE